MDFIDIFEDEPMVETLEKQIDDAIKCAIDLRYPKKCIEQLEDAKSLNEINNILITYRRQM